MDRNKVAIQLLKLANYMDEDWITEKIRIDGREIIRELQNEVDDQIEEGEVSFQREDIYVTCPYEGDKYDMKDLGEDLIKILIRDFNIEYEIDSFSRKTVRLTPY
jgi:hypothetical protein